MKKKCIYKALDFFIYFKSYKNETFVFYFDYTVINSIVTSAL